MVFDILHLCYHTDLLYIVALHLYLLRRVTIDEIKLDRDEAFAERDEAMEVCERRIADAAKIARLDERQHFAKILDRHKDKSASMTSKITNLTTRTVTAEKQLRSSDQQANQSTKRAQVMSDHYLWLEMEVKKLKELIQAQTNELNDNRIELEEAKTALVDATEAMPFKCIEKVRQGRGGKSTWPLHVWELIIEQLVNGTPPSSVNDNIVAHVKTFSPKTEIKSLPSIWTIRRARTVLLVIVQTLAVHRIAKADKWEQLFTDATSRHQECFQDLIISIEEDDTFK